MTLWDHCLEHLESELQPQHFNTWIRPLQAVEDEPSLLRLLAPNQFVLDRVRDNYQQRIEQILGAVSHDGCSRLVLEVGSQRVAVAAGASTGPAAAGQGVSGQIGRGNGAVGMGRSRDPGSNESRLNAAYTFDRFVEGKSNQLARAASMQVASNPGDAYNPLFIYGGSGLGKTHLMHAVGNGILARKPGAKVVYLHSERFVADMVKALQHNSINDFKHHYRGLDALLIDDIQFFAGKERSQEEFFHTFNALLEGQRQVILTCDRYPKEVEGLEERLKSRFGWGLTVAVEPPELETRVAILKAKASQMQADLPDEVAFFVAKHLRSNVRELEGALRRVIANANFTGREITVDFAREALRDLLSVQEKLVTMENIQKIVADYYQIRVADMLSKRRTRSITRPRQFAMALAKELTNHSLPEIGDAFGGRDHTTVLHACRKVVELRDSEARLHDDYNKLVRQLTSG